MTTNINQSYLLLDQVQRVVKFYSEGKYRFICQNSPNFIRHVLNAVISKLLNVDVNNSFLILKSNQRAVFYFELRILIYLRSNNFQIDELANIVSELKASANSSQYFHKVDLQLLEVLPTFKAYIKDPVKIDKLIKVHQYVNGIWKNGSKYLHFYTLHNEEHSIELIKQCVKITKTIDYLKLKSDDYYVLFLACYLHDISMALHPNLEMFAGDSNETDLIYCEWKRDVYEAIGMDLLKTSENKFVTDLEHVNKADLKKILLSYFRKLDEYFEATIRNSHAYLSASFIKSQTDLRFIDKAFLQLVAEVSEAHYYDAKDVYKLKSKARDDLFDVKYLMIILRLADLLDMTRERISTNFMKQNIDYMSGISKYHWISHLSINNCHLEAGFDPVLPENGEDVSINEKIKLVINLNTSQLTSVSTGGNCTNWGAAYDEEKNTMVIQINDHLDNGKEKKCNYKCNLSCKWFVKKQEYLFNELYELQRYLNRTENNIFKTHFQVELHFDSTDALPQEYLDVIMENI